MYEVSFTVAKFTEESNTAIETLAAKHETQGVDYGFCIAGGDTQYRDYDIVFELFSNAQAFLAELPQLGLDYTSTPAIFDPDSGDEVLGK